MSEKVSIFNKGKKPTPNADIAQQDRATAF